MDGRGKSLLDIHNDHEGEGYSIGNAVKSVGGYAGSLINAIGPKKAAFTGLAYLAGGPLLGALAFGASAFGTSAVGKDMINAIGPKKAAFTGLAYLAGGPFGPLTGALALGVASEGKDVAREIKKGALGYVDTSAKAKGYESLEKIMNNERVALGMDKRRALPEGFYGKLLAAKSYEKMEAEAGGMKLEDYISGKVRNEKALDLEAKISRAVFWDSNLEEVDRLVGEYETLCTGIFSLAAVKKKIKGYEAAKAKAEVVRVGVEREKARVEKERVEGAGVSIERNEENSDVLSLDLSSKIREIYKTDVPEGYLYNALEVRNIANRFNEAERKKGESLELKGYDNLGMPIFGSSNSNPDVVRHVGKWVNKDAKKHWDI